MEVRPGVESELQHGLCHSHHWAKPGIEPHPYRGNGSLTQWAAMGTLDHRFKCKYKTIKHLGEKEEIYHITKIQKNDSWYDFSYILKSIWNKQYY